jgi:hypothetical protein
MRSPTLTASASCCCGFMTFLNASEGKDLPCIVSAVCAKRIKIRPRATPKPASPHNLAAPNTNEKEPIRKTISMDAACCLALRLGPHATRFTPHQYTLRALASVRMPAASAKALACAPKIPGRHPYRPLCTLPHRRDECPQSRPVCAHQQVARDQSAHR